MILIASILPTLMFTAGCALLVMILLRRSYKYFGGRKRKQDNRPIDAQPRPESAWSGSHNDASAMIEKQKVQLHDFQRDVTAQIDSKIILLNELIVKSQRQIDRLEELLAEAEK